jgi:hypothetical protein
MKLYKFVQAPFALGCSGHLLGEWLRFSGCLWFGLVCFLGVMHSQPLMAGERVMTMNVQQLRALGRYRLLRLAVDEVRLQLPDFDPEGFDEIRVRSSDSAVVVRFTLHVRLIQRGADGHDFYKSSPDTLEVVFTQDQRRMNPDPKQFFKYMQAVREAQHVLQDTGVPIHSSKEVSHILIEDRVDAYLVTVTRRAPRAGMTGGAEQYNVNKKTKQRTKLWHEHPMKLPGEAATEELNIGEEGWEEIAL